MPQYSVATANPSSAREIIIMFLNLKYKQGLVHRSDFFPGLGWMMLRTFWLEIRNSWPEGFWDDWIRDKKQRKDRACLRPEVSRTEMSGKSAKGGVSMCVS